MPTGIFKADFHFVDGCTMWELHPNSSTDYEVLTRLQKQTRYQRMPGEWEVALPHDQKTFEDPDFTKAMQAASNYAWERDHPEWHGGFC